MKPHLVHEALKVVSSQQILVNIVSRRVRQLSVGARPMVEFLPGLGHADVALREIAEGKLTFERNGEANDEPHIAAEVVQFPGAIATKKARKKNAA